MAEEASEKTAPVTSASTAAVTPQIDYDKLAGIINGKQSVTEDTVLKGYFKQQGLSQTEMGEAISAYKAEKAKHVPDINAITTELESTKKALASSKVHEQAVLSAMQQGVDGKRIPYVIKLAELSQVLKQDGSIDKELLDKAVGKVLEDLPELKSSTVTPSADTKQTGGFTIGGNAQPNNDGQKELLEGIFGIHNKK